MSFNLRNALKLYLVTDRNVTGEKSLTESVEKALRGGVTMLQLREKNIDDNDYAEIARRVKRITDSYGVPLIINDNVRVAACVGADGVHLGANDGDIGSARKLLGKKAIIGASCRNIAAALAAENEGANYLGVGAVFGTSTKGDAQTISTDILSGICGAVDIPVVAIGGVNDSNALLLRGSGIAGIAVVSAVLGTEDAYKAARLMRTITDKIL